MSASNPDLYCSTTEAARLLGVSVGTVQQMVEDGRLQAWKTTGGHRRIVLASVQELQQTVPAPAAHPDRGLRVYVVEDDKTLLMTYEKMLQRLPFDIDYHGFENGLDALLQLGNLAPHLLILDLEIPLIDGYAMLQRIKAFTGPKPLHILVVSGNLPNQRPELDGVVLLPKPLSFDLLHGYLLALQQQLNQPWQAAPLSA